MDSFPDGGKSSRCWGLPDHLLTNNKKKKSKENNVSCLQMADLLTVHKDGRTHCHVTHWFATNSFRSLVTDFMFSAVLSFCLVLTCWS